MCRGHSELQLQNLRAGLRLVEVSSDCKKFIEVKTQAKVPFHLFFFYQLSPICVADRQRKTECSGNWDLDFDLHYGNIRTRFLHTFQAAAERIGHLAEVFETHAKGVL